MGFRGLDKYKKTISDDGDKALRKVVLTAFTLFILGSPVDTGRFRANWRAEVGRVDLTTDENTQSGVMLGTGVTFVEMANLSPGLRAKLGQTVFVTNNLPYAGRLENGWSAQAPSGILHINVAKVRAALNRGATGV